MEKLAVIAFFFGGLTAAIGFLIGLAIVVGIVYLILRATWADPQ